MNPAENELEIYKAKTQRHITLVLLYGLLILIAALIVAAFLPWPINDKLSVIVNSLITGVLSLTSGAVGFWIARSRTTDSPNPIQPTPAPKT